MYIYKYTYVYLHIYIYIYMYIYIRTWAVITKIPCQSPKLLYLKWPSTTFLGWNARCNHQLTQTHFVGQTSLNICKGATILGWNIVNKIPFKHKNVSFAYGLVWKWLPSMPLRELNWGMISHSSWIFPEEVYRCTSLKMGYPQGHHDFPLNRQCFRGIYIYIVMYIYIVKYIVIYIYK